MDSRAKVLQLFKALHRTRKDVFKGDNQALEVLYCFAVARQKINLEFRNHLTESSPDQITKLLKLGSDVEVILRKTVIQGVHTNHNTIFLRAREDVLLDNVPFNENPTEKT
ncbi:complex III assembly factor LYRM7 isoform X2 [Narcine bancroftii]|uniref:complex III assembly factor LYRM7 isoform X2 n=1 Tax=Narcine bancroftii TaxID=1343680 RepID=UPI003831A222